jgi:hypothetical protein
MVPETTLLSVLIAAMFDLWLARAISLGNL